MFAHNHDLVDMIVDDHIREELNRAQVRQQLQELRGRQRGGSYGLVCRQLTKLGQLMIVLGRRLESLGSTPTTKLSCAGNPNSMEC